MKSVGLLVVISILVLHPFSAVAQLNKQKPKNIRDVGIEEHLGDTIPLDLKFATSEGDSVTLNELLAGNDKPVILNPVYYNCPMLCSMVIGAILNGVKDLKWNPGKDYKIITFSFNPDEHMDLAASTKDSVLNLLDKKGSDDGWYFLTGREKAIKKLTQAVGFQYHPLNNGTGQFAHSAGIMFLSPEGKITRYLYGIKFDKFDVKNALYEAADGNIGSTVDKVVLYCYCYNPSSQSYTPVASRIMEVGGYITMTFLGIFLGLLWLKERRKKNNRNESKNNS